MGPMLRASLGSPAVFALVLVAACSAQPLTPEERRSLELETYCRGIAEDERSKLLAQREQSQVDEIGNNDELWQGATQGSGLSGKYQAAYAKCMKENQPE